MRLVQRDRAFGLSWLPLHTLARADVTEIEIVGVEPILAIFFGGR